MTWTTLDTWTVAIAVLCSLSCALLGSFLLLRKMSMMGDAISHAVLPGLAAAFLITESRSSVVMFAGAAVVGVLTALFTQWVHSFGKVDHGASMGVVFTTLFAIGLVLISSPSLQKVDLDAECVLYGAIETAAADYWRFAGLVVPRAVVVLAGVLLMNVTLVALFYKELKITSFDPALATTLGINATAMNYLLMTLVAVTTVAAFEAIGSILVIAMLIVPAAAAHLLTERLSPMIVVALIFAAVSAALGHVAAIGVPAMFGLKATTTAGMMGTVAGLLFLIVMLAAPRHGILTRLLHQRRLSHRIVREDILGVLYRMEEREGKATPALPADMPLAVVIGGGSVAGAVTRLLREGKLTREPAGIALTDAGRAEARGIIRAHRLWETYLDQNLPLPLDHLHAPAERLEHVTDVAMQHKLAEATEHPRRDPQGKQVPPDA